MKRRQHSFFPANNVHLIQQIVLTLPSRKVKDLQLKIEATPAVVSDQDTAHSKSPELSTNKQDPKVTRKWDRKISNWLD